MRSYILSVSMALAAFSATNLQAQDAVWLQVEAQPTLPEATARAQYYAKDRQNVAGFYMGSGWYAVALGPYSPADAEALRQRLIASGDIPADSYINYSRNFRNQYFPVGSGAPQTAQPLPGAAASTPQASDAQPAAAPAPAPQEPQMRDPGESKSEARASEADLSKDDKRDLQVALKWAGVYSGAIDGLYGRGTRASMAAWQAANQYPETGILTTSQRAELLAAYNAILDGMGLQVVQDDASGIRMQMPMGVVEFTRYDAPFARFGPYGDMDAQVLMISQAGDEQTLAGLFEIMQTLEIVPTEGPRGLSKNAFVLEGISDSIHSYTEAKLSKGEIKGFTLVWPAGDDKRRSRVLQEMVDSFERIDGTLDPNLITPGAEQATDMVSGLAIRKPLRSRTGFYAGTGGEIVTSADLIADCGRITVNGDTDVTVTYSDATTGIAVLTPTEALSPRAQAQFQSSVPRLQSKIALAGFPYGGVLPTAAMTFGTLADLRGLDGDTAINRLTLVSEPSEIGGPVFDNGGRVIGMLLPPISPSGKQLPKDVAFSISSTVITQALTDTGIAHQVTDAADYMTAEDITSQAAKMTVLARCWE